MAHLPDLCARLHSNLRQFESEWDKASADWKDGVALEFRSHFVTEIVGTCRAMLGALDDVAWEIEKLRSRVKRRY